MKNVITFDKSLKKDILSVFGKEVDGEGFVIEADTKQRVLSPDGEEVAMKEFAGVSKGSEVFIKSDLFSLINFSKRGDVICHS
jgi:hypothetical protein